MSMEGMKRSAGDFMKEAKDLLDGMKVDWEHRRELKRSMKTPVHLTDIDGKLVGMFNDSFPGVGFTEENIQDLLTQAGLTEFEYVDFLESCAYGSKIATSITEKMATLKGSAPETQK